MKILIAANWKLNPDSSREAKKIFNSITKGIQGKKFAKETEILICPPFIYLHDLTVSKQIKLGGQNIFYEETGAFTGEISSTMLKEAGCQYVLIGHSERRRYFSETNESINLKIKAAINAKLTPVLCVGETQEEKQSDKTKEVLEKQLFSALKTVTPQKIKESNLVIAYEPVWAIGTGNACPATEAQTIGILLEKIITQKYSRSIAQNIRFLYGGSVNSKNARDFVREAKFQGLLIGGASLKPKEFIDIIKNVYE